MSWPSFPSRLNQFAYNLFHRDAPVDSDSDGFEDELRRIPEVQSRISVFHSSTAIFFAPSDISGVGGMRKEVVRAAPSWRRGPPRYDCVFVATGSAEGFKGLHVARIKIFFSFKVDGKAVSCALVHWFESVGTRPDTDTGMWIVEPEYLPVLPGADVGENRKPKLAIISLDTVLRATHLIPVFGDGFIPVDTEFSASLDRFDRFFVNKYADHHSYEIAF